MDLRLAIAQLHLTLALVRAIGGALQEYERALVLAHPPGRA